MSDKMGPGQSRGPLILDVGNFYLFPQVRTMSLGTWLF